VSHATPPVTPHAPAPAPRPQRFDPEQLGFKPRRPVPWLGPVLLAATGARVALAEQFGAYLDKRELQNALDKRLHDHSVDADGHHRDELWFDFVADLGDGFDATYSVAYSIAQPELKVDGRRLPRGEVLVMGGDEVYPTASSEAYEDRFRGPYKAALPAAPPDGSAPTIFALPGNHDWYDGLTAFLRIFARRGGGTIGGWKTEQTRSYFALKLPHGWWLFAIDAQPGSYLDDPQLAYFHEMAEQVRPGDRVIVAAPNPFWVESAQRPRMYDTLDYFLRTVIAPTGAEVPLMLSGDLHHYARYANERRQLITSGGGGAYLYPTHKLPKKILVPPRDSIVLNATPSEEFDLGPTYPTRAKSRGLGTGVFFRLPMRNPGFVALLGVLQVLLLLALDNIGGRLLPKVLMFAAILALTLLLAAGLNTPRTWVHYTLGVVHCLAQFGLGLAGMYLWRASALHDLSPPWRELATVAPYGIVAAFISVEVSALYFLVASIFGVNVNELFAGQGIQRYKGFLRMHIAADGTLTIYPIGIEAAAKRWRANPEGAAHEPWFRPAQPLDVVLIEPPIPL
jgi:hypothetical protein